MGVSLIIKSNPGIIQISDYEFSSFNEEGWIKCCLNLKVDCFEVSLSTQFWKPDLEAFQKSIDDFIKDDKLKICFNVTEDFISLEGKTQYNGTVLWKGKIHSINDSSNFLCFNLETDKSVVNDLSVALSYLLRN